MSGWAAFFFFLMSIPLGGAIALWVVFHYLSRLRRGNDLSREEQQRLADLWQEANALDQRTANLETLLDRSDPGWRRHEEEQRF